MWASSATSDEYSFLQSVASTIGNWVRNRKLPRQDRRCFDQLSDFEVARMARDAGLSAHELRCIAQLSPDAAQLLSHRMGALNLDVDSVSETDMNLMRDMQRLCCTCDVKKQCERDLIIRPDNPIWRQYCPNECTLMELQSRGPKSAISQKR
jgi:hypothetical protein